MKKVNLMILIMALIPLRSFATELDKADCIALQLKLQKVPSVTVEEEGYVGSNRARTYDPSLTKEQNEEENRRMKEEDRAEDERHNREVDARNKAKRAEAEKKQAVFDAQTKALKAVYDEGHCGEKFQKLDELVKAKLN